MKPRGRGQRRRVPDLELIHEARMLSRRQAKLEADLEAVNRERLRTVLELRSLGVSLQDTADLLDVSRGRVSQLEHRAHAAGIEHDTGRCPYCARVAEATDPN